MAPDTQDDALALLEGRLLRVRTLHRDMIDHHMDAAAYYNASDRAYRFLHSRKGAMHVALNDDGSFDPSGYLGQAQIVKKEIGLVKSGSVLDLACGTGFDLAYLARRHSDVKFTGLDLTRSHVAVAQRRLRRLRNVSVDEGDFQDAPYEDDSFDLIYAIEGLCHSLDVIIALSECYRLLRPRGCLIVIERFRAESYDDLSSVVREAATIAEESLAAYGAWRIDEWQSLAEQTGFCVEEVSDLTTQIHPNLRRFERLATPYFEWPIARLFDSAVSRALRRNAVAGYLMPATVSAGAHVYLSVNLRK